ncbi:MAG: hypothetical protein ABSD62_11640 [Candidatus Limnocylindrales bacterium]|jgi:hypothetical protein
MSSAGDRIAAVGEFGLWVTAAVLIAGAAGMRLPADLLASSKPSPTPTVSVVAVASGSPAASASLAPSPSPTSAPTLSPLVGKLQAYLARKDFQFQATGTGSQSATGTNLSVDFTLSGSLSYRAGDESDTTKMTSQGKTVAYDNVYTGSFAYERSNGGPWIKKPRQPSDTAEWRIFLSSSRLFVDTGVETKNGRALHRLEVADSAALSTEVDAIGTVSGARVTMVFWTKDDGTPVVFRMEGTWDEQVNGVQAHVTTAQEFVFSKSSGVTITAPSNPWQWIVDGIARVAFGAPSDWSESDVNKTIGATTYAGASGQIVYVTQDAAGMTLDQTVAAVIGSFHDPAEGRMATTVGGEPAAHFGVHRSAQKDYVSETVVIHAGKIYAFSFFGIKGKDAATDAMAAQILATLTFTK